MLPAIPSTLTHHLLPSSSLSYPHCLPILPSLQDPALIPWSQHPQAPLPCLPSHPGTATPSGWAPLCFSHLLLEDTTRETVVMTHLGQTLCTLALWRELSWLLKLGSKFWLQSLHLEGISCFSQVLMHPLPPPKGTSAALCLKCISCSRQNSELFFPRRPSLVITETQWNYISFISIAGNWG